MVSIAYCYENEKELSFVKSTIENYFYSQDISVLTNCYHSVHELLHFSSSRMPDVLFFNSENSYEHMLQAVIYLKKYNNNLISIVTSNKVSFIGNISDRILLEPIYTASNQKQLLHYALLAYKASTSNNNYFEYYRRPEYMQIPVNDIVYFQSEGRKIYMYCSDTSYYDNDTFYQKLDNVCDELKHKSCNFLRIHKSIVVNQIYISNFDRFSVRLTSGEHLKISNYDYYNNLKKNWMSTHPISKSFAI